MAKSKKILKKILITLFVLIAVIAVGAYCIFNFYIKPKYADKVMEAVNVILEDDELMAEIGEVLEDEQLQAEIGEVLSDDLLSADISGALEGIDIPTEQPVEHSSTAAPSQSAPSQTAQPPADTAAEAATQAPTKAPEKNQSLMEKAKENVEPKDFADGMRLAGKIDVGYILSLMSGGLTDEEMAEAKKYLKSRYTKAERNRIKGYIAKYSYLLE